MIESAADTSGHPIVRSARVVSALTLMSRITGLVRDIFFGYFFGASGVASAFTVAFAIPNLFRRLFGEGALSAALIPVVSRRLGEGGLSSASKVAGRVFAWLAVVVAGVVVLGEVGLLVLRLVPWESEQARLTLGMTGLLLPYAVLVCLVAAMGGVLNVLGRFAIPASAPILLNVVLLGTMFGAWALRAEDAEWRIWALGGSVLLAGVIQLAAQAGALRSAGLRAEWRLSRDDPGLREVGSAMLPMILGLAAVQINSLGDTIVALTCVPHAGAPAVLYYAQRLYQFPLGVFGLALATAAYPVMSAHAAAGDRESLRAAVVDSARVVLYVGLAASVGLMVTAGPLVQAFFERGGFVAADTRRVSVTLVAYAAGVWAYGLNHILVRGFYAMGDRRTPMRVALVMVVVNLGLNLTLVWQWEEAGLGAATAISGALQCVWLGRLLARRLGLESWGELVGSVVRSLFGGLVMALAVVGAHRLLDVSTGPITRAAVLVVVGAISYALVTGLLGSRELKELTSK